MRFELLTNASQWQEHKNRVALSQGVPLSMTAWGDGPTRYPCLVATAFVNTGPPRFMSCYVYQEDFQLFNQLSGFKQAEQPVHSPSVETAAEPEKVLSKELPETMRYVSANLLAIVRTLIGIGITSMDRYEKDFAWALQKVDQQPVTAEGFRADSLLLAAADGEETGGGQ